MKKQQKKNLIIGSLVLVISVIGLLFYLGNVKVTKTGDGLSVQLYDKDKQLIKNVGFSIINIGGQTFENVEFIKVNYKVTNNGNIPLTIKVIETEPQISWVTTQSLVNPQQTYTFESNLISTSEFELLPQPVNFYVKAKGESSQLSVDRQPETYDVLLLNVKEDVAIVADIQGDLNMGYEFCTLNIPCSDFVSQNDCIQTEAYCNKFTNINDCNSLMNEGFCVWR